MRSHHPNHRHNPLLPFLALLALATSAIPEPSLASSYVMTTDDELLAGADAVVQGTIVALRTDPDGATLPATAYLLEVDQIFAGHVPTGSVEVRVAGGLDAVGDSWVVWGAPRFEIGEELVLFLEAHDDGYWRPLHSSLGTFRQVRTARGPFVTRDLGSTHEIYSSGDPLAAERARSHQPRELTRFATWIRARAAGQDVTADYFVDSIPAPSSVLKYNLIGSGTQSPPNGCGSSGGNPIRVFDFDRGAAFRFDAHSSGQDGIAGGGFAELQTAMKAWNKHSESDINLTYTGTTNDMPVAGSTRQTVLWNDPRNEIPGAFSGGGILAQTVTGYRCDLEPFPNGKAHPIGGALVVTQNGLGEFLAGRASASSTLAEILGHELGHALGFAHSCENQCSGAAGDALMAAHIHADGRGARLGSDDKAAAAYLYPAANGGAGDDPDDGNGSGGGSTATKPARPTNLTARSVSTTGVTLEWRDRSGNELEFRIERRNADGSWSLFATAAQNSNSKALSGLRQATYYVFRVSARNANGSSHSNEVGVTTRATPGVCRSDANTVCLRSSRFRATVDYLTKQGQNGRAEGKRYTNDTALFSFFSASNVELTLKVLDGCAFGNHWVFVAGMTNLETVVTVSDMKTGNTKSYLNSQGTAFLPVQDTRAFVCE